MKCPRKLWLEGGSAAAARNVSSPTRVGNSQSSRRIAAFPHPSSPGTQAQGEFGMRTGSLRSGPLGKEFGPGWVRGSPLLLTCWDS